MPSLQPQWPAAAMPHDYVRLWSHTLALAVEANLVVAYRTLGASGLWPVAGDESWTAVSEKGPAFVEAALGSWYAAASGQRPDQIANAALVPIGRKARSNRKRLASGKRRKG